MLAKPLTGLTLEHNQVVEPIRSHQGLGEVESFFSTGTCTFQSVRVNGMDRFERFKAKNIFEFEKLNDREKPIP